MCSTTLFRKLTFDQIALLKNPVDIVNIASSRIAAQAEVDLVEGRIMSTFLVGNFDDNTAEVFELWALLLNFKLEDDDADQVVDIDRWNNEGGFICGSVH